MPWTINLLKVTWYQKKKKSAYIETVAVWNLGYLMLEVCLFLIEQISWTKIMSPRNKQFFFLIKHNNNDGEAYSVVSFHGVIE